jgi:glucose dehydrogenase
MNQVGAKSEVWHRPRRSAPRQLKASTGTFVWGFQVARHDLWDYDVASQPALIDYRGRPSVALTTKIGHVFVLDRLTGKPLHTVEERAVPKSDIPGEDAAASQPASIWGSFPLSAWLWVQGRQEEYMACLAKMIELPASRWQSYRFNSARLWV